jgi:hypothetical protein
MIMGLLKANVPYDVIMKWDSRQRAAALIVAGKMDGGDFIWETREWINI